jgi:acetyl-CoA carboxylase biotin carboxyl carrier protein
MTAERFEETVRRLAQIMTETGLSEIEIEDKLGRVRVVRAGAAPAAAAMTAAATPAAAPPTPTLPITDDAHHPGAVLSPMVGIAYLASEPGAPFFVTVGQAVEVGQTLLLIEAMKTFNQIKATRAGTVTRILVASGSPVEYGQPMMIIE